MAEALNGPKGSFASALGGVVGLIASELGAAVAVVGSLWAAFAILLRAEDERSAQWPLYLVSGTIFVAVLVACRCRGRS